MSLFSRRANLSNERYNRILKIAELDPLTFRYEQDIELEYGKYLNDPTKEDFLTQVSNNANLRILTERHRRYQGKEFGHTFSLVIGQPVRIDLVNAHASTGIAGTIPITVGQAVWGVRITNKGNGDLLYSLNTNDNGSALLVANTAPVERLAERETYEVINLQAIGSDATVNVAILL